jgi:hypothetical protein
MSIFAYSTGVSGFGGVVVFSLLATQFVVWLTEIRAAGFRPWMRDSMKYSYVGHIRRYGRPQWRLFASVFGAVFVIFTLIWSLRL